MDRVSRSSRSSLTQRITPEQDQTALRAPAATGFCLWIVSTCVKILLFPAYRSTDFLVHRHWKALTRTLPLEEWYFDDRHVDTVYTLDYPPGFALWESVWANLYQGFVDWLLPSMGMFDDGDSCLQLLADERIQQDPDVISSTCVAYLRSTVVASDLLLWIGAYAVASACGSAQSRPFWTVFLLITLHPGLLWLDHVHFQYNGMLLGWLLLSVGCLMHGNQCNTGKGLAFHAWHLAAAVSFAVLLAMKHLYLTLSLWYFAYLLRRYCFVKDKFSWFRLTSLGLVTFTTLLAPFLPFLWSAYTSTSMTMTAQLHQIISRLFPFSRGLVHDYWAGNLWAVYATSQKVGAAVGITIPTPIPLLVFLLLLLGLLPGSVYAWKAARLRCNYLLLLSLSYSTWASFLLAYHVHEKAIMTTLLPLTVWCVGCFKDQSQYLLLFWTNAFAMLGLFPLLFQPTELLLKVSSFVAYLAFLKYLATDNCNTRQQSISRWGFWCVSLCLGAMILQLEIIPVRLYGKFEFLPLALTSLTTAFGLIMGFAFLTHHMLSSD